MEVAPSFQIDANSNIDFVVAMLLEAYAICQLD